MGVERDLRFLCSCDAERMSDYKRINAFVKAGMEAVNELEQLKRAYMQLAQDNANRFHITEVKGMIESARAGGLITLNEGQGPCYPKEDEHHGC